MAGPFRILIIEDDPEHADLIRMGFRRHDEFFLNFAASGEAGLEMISSGTYDLISVDLVLPGIGGLDVLVRIRKLDPDIPVVMVSGHGTTEMAVVAFENRATKYVVKSLESFKSLPYIFENLIQEARFKASERAMREQIERSERIHRNIVENALAGIYILQDGAFRLVNPKLGEIFGCSAESLVGMPFWQLVQPDDLHCVSRLETACSDVPVYESKVQRKDGSYRWIEFRTIPIEYEGRRAVLGNLLDITHRKELEIEMRRAVRELSAMNGIMESCQISSDLNGMLAEALNHIISGIEDVELGGVFLKEEGGLVLRALQGSVEDMMDFIKGMPTGELLSRAGVLKSRCEGPEAVIWISAPIICKSLPQGVVILRRRGAAEKEAIAFLEKAALRAGRLLDIPGTALLASHGAPSLSPSIKSNPCQS
ncbi:MAG TPA: PAS domain S-box protein [Methanothrix sp.]|jgi:PAS domain S-box-containing protein|nr:PAS domain S-box protein [Methanothrix sp.]